MIYRQFSPGTNFLAFAPGPNATWRVSKKRGRPKTGSQTRDAEVTFALTPEDAQWFAQVANDLGFTSRGQFFTAVMERLRIGGLAPFAFAKVGYQIAKRAEETGASKGAGFWNPFRDPIPPLGPPENRPRPTPALPDEQLSARETKQLLTEIRKELQST